MDFIVDEGWPKSFETVSKMDAANIYVNDWGYGAIAKKCSLVVSSPSFQDTVEVLADSLEGVGNRLKFRADLTSVWEKHPLENGTYTLNWKLHFILKTLKANNSIEEQNIDYTPQTIVYGDISAPGIAFDTTFTKNTVSFHNDDAFAYVVSLDTLENRILRGLRSFLVRKDSKETLDLLHRANVGEPSYAIGRTDTMPSWSGYAELYVQAFDFANPDNITKTSLINAARDSAKNSWALVMQNDTTFKNGINGTSIHRTILVDNEPPQVANEHVEVLSFIDSSIPTFAKKQNGSEILLNAKDTLLVSFDINENLFGRDSESVSVELVFKDSLGTENIRWKRYLQDSTIKKSSRNFIFKEPDATRLNDGVYSLTVILIDEVGNKSEKSILENLHVDRTAPQIRGVTLGDVAYANVAELKNGTAYLSEEIDDSRNLSDLDCYVKVSVNDGVGKWVGPVAESGRKNSLNFSYEFDIMHAVTDFSDGIWYVYFGCFDDAGNFRMNMNFIGMGARYPEITYPKSSSEFYTNKMLVKGVAPNPDVHGNSNKGTFQISWKKLEDSTWSENGIDYLVFDKSLSATERDLAVWNIAKLNLEKGEYAIRLSVRECDTCKWISSETIVPVDDLILPDSANAPKLVITPPVGNQVSGHTKDATIELKNVPSSSKWIVKASIEAPSPKDSSVYIRALEKTFDPMTISPFRVPALASDTGLSIWQENDGCTWHVRYAGTALGIKLNDSAEKRMEPSLAIRFIKENIDWLDSPKADSTDELSILMDSIRVKNDDVDFLIPAYNKTNYWTVGKDSVHLTFKTTSSFTVDISSIDISTIDSARYKSSLYPVVYVHPESYKAHVAWNGLVNGTYPSGSLVRMNVVAYEKGNEKNIISESAQWYLEYEKTGIEISSNNLDKYYVNFLGSNSDSTAMAAGDYGFQFKLTGRSAFVWAEILDSTRNVVHTLLDSALILATATDQWQTLRWNGVRDDSFVQAGSYSVHILVKNDTGAVVIDTLYPFEMKHGENIREAAKDSSGRTAELTMLEAALDSSGNYRYVGKPDYLLRTNVTATTLPKERRTFNYEWDVYGTQYPIEYMKTRPSLGIRRHRDEFWVTVVTMVMSESKKYQITDGPWNKNHCVQQDDVKKYMGYWYKLSVEKVRFLKGEKYKEIPVDLNDTNGNKTMVYGYTHNSHDSDPNDTLHNLVAIKVFPASSYEYILGDLHGKSYFENAVSSSKYQSAEDFPWDLIYQKGSYMDSDTSRLLHWFNNWGMALYYEAVNTDFKILSKLDSLQNTFGDKSSTTPACTPDSGNTLTENESKFVCGPKTAKDEIDSAVIAQFNPHAFMMDVRLEPFDGDSIFVKKNFNKDHCSEMDGSGTDIKVKFVLSIDSNYWEPSNWGTNNLANRYVRFDPLNKTLYGEEGYVKKLHHLDWFDFTNFYDGSKWVKNSALNNGPTVFEAQRLWVWPVPENPLMFNDEIDTSRFHNDPSAHYYPSVYSWRFYRGSDDFTFKAETRKSDGELRSTFSSNDPAATSGKDEIIKELPMPHGIYFDVAPMMSLDTAKIAVIIKNANTSVSYPLGDKNCNVTPSEGFRFYGCDKLVSHVHENKDDWTDDLWENTFLIGRNGYFRNPLTDDSATLYALTSVKNPQKEFDLNKTLTKHVDSADWNPKKSAWSFVLKPDTSSSDFLFGQAISIGGYRLKSNQDDSLGWEIDTTNANLKKFTVQNRGKLDSATLDFYRSRDSIFTTPKSLNNVNLGDTVPLARVVAQSSATRDTILSSIWSRNLSATSVNVYKRKMQNDLRPIQHPYLRVAYDSSAKQFIVNRNSTDIYANREDEIVTLRGSVPFPVMDWKISYVQNGMRFKVAEGRDEPIEGSMNVNKLHGNTSFFLTYKGVDNFTYYRQLDVHIGNQVKARTKSLIQSMYGNVSVAFDENAWANDADVNVRTMDPSECYDCSLFRNMAPVGPVLEMQPSHVFPAGHEPIVTIDISMATLKEANVDYRNLKIYKLDAVNKKIIPLELVGLTGLFNSNKSECKAADSSKCTFVRLSAKTPTFSEFIVMDSLKAGSVVAKDSVDGVEPFSCAQMDGLWNDTLWMGTINGWLEYPYLCNGKSNYLLQLSSAGYVSAEHRGASSAPIVWPARNPDLNKVDSVYQSTIVFYGIDGNTEQKLGPVVRLDSVAPIIENVEIAESESEDGSRIIHVEADIDETGSGLAKTTAELFFGGNLLRSETALNNDAPVYDFKLEKRTCTAALVARRQSR
ncbi:hypothetical protein [Hallerella porci]|nr:hypothetical protein [Hallerella porci]